MTYRRSTIPIRLLLAAVPVLLTAGEQEATLEANGNVIPRIASPVVIDGILDDEAWNSAWVGELKYEVSPGENTPAPVRTEVLVMYDERNAYFGFRASDPNPEHIRCHIKDRDNLWADDWVGVILDTFNDERRSYDLLVNPAGVQSDFVETASNGEDEWDAIWESAGKLTGWGYSVEMKVPFSSLRFQRATGRQTWGIDAVRNYPRDRTYRFTLFPRDRDNNCYLCQATKIEGFENVTPGKNIELVPTLTGVRTDVREDFPDGEMQKRDQKADVGFTARWGLTTNLTLAGTINPDFSQVEADALQLDINEPFALFYPEKRPFFQEGSDFFNTSFDVVYTRTMREPRWGAKLTGKENAHTIGSYVVQDDVTNLIFPANTSSDSTSLDMRSTDSVFRYKHDFGSDYTVGVIATDREGEGYFNRLAGFDADLRFTSRDHVWMQVLGSSTRYPNQVAAHFNQPEGTFGDHAIHFAYEHDTRTFDYWALYRNVGTGFRADVGFIPKVGYRGYLGGAGYTWNPSEDSWYSRINLSGEYVYHDDQQGALLNKYADITLQYEGKPRESHSIFELIRKREVYNAREFDLTQVFVHQCMNPTGDSHVYLNVYAGDRVDYANTQPGRRLRLAPGIGYDIGRHLRVDLSHTYEKMNVDAGRLYTANLSELIAAYQVNTRTFVRAILQYVDYRYDAVLYVDPIDPVYKHLFTQFLFSYKLNPHTVFFLGYSDNYDPDVDYELVRCDRTVFTKIGYAWTM
ncbi:MAG: DUF5916 domain-containing protein [Acidobacteriota bacterium]